MAAISMAPGHASFNSTNGLENVFASWDHVPGHNESSSSSSDYDASNAHQNGAGDGYFGSRESRPTSPAMDEPHAKYGANGANDDDNSKWIHRDKLAKIESEELQAAGITLPKARTQSRPRRDRSHSRRRAATESTEQQHASRSRKDSDLARDPAPEPEPSNWDLRVPQDIAEDPSERVASSVSSPKSVGKGTRIPLPKVHAPITTDFSTKSNGSKSTASLFDEESSSIKYPKSRSRSNSIANALDDAPKITPGKRPGVEGSPKKAAARKTPAASKSTPQNRPKARSNTISKNGTSARPPTRPGELSAKAPEGDPPWMISAYQPDPRLPPEQQLLPTVARRLQQEKWEQEGALGSVFDKDFRPLNTGTFGTPPEPGKPQEELEIEEPQNEKVEFNEKDQKEEKEKKNDKNETEKEKVKEEKEEKGENNENNEKNEWPLKAEAARAPTPSRSHTNSYSTMPKIQDTPATNTLQVQTQSAVAVRVPDPPANEEENEKAGCGCCVVM